MKITAEYLLELSYEELCWLKSSYLQEGKVNDAAFIQGFIRHCNTVEKLFKK